MFARYILISNNLHLIFGLFLKYVFNFTVFHNFFKIKILNYVRLKISYTTHLLKCVTYGRGLVNIFRGYVMVINVVILYMTF